MELPRAFKSVAPAPENKLVLGDTALRVEFAAIDATPAHWTMAWDVLAAEASEPNAFAERWFVSASSSLADRNVRIAAVWGEQRLIGVIALTIVPNYGRARVRHVENWLHYHNFLGLPLIAAGWETPFWRGLLAALDDADWAPGFVHIAGLVADGPVARGLEQASSGRGHAIVHRARRALLQAGLSADAYYKAHVRKKKRKEIARLRARLEELGQLSFARLADGGDITVWCDAFLLLERSGWKVEGGALANQASTERFFREAMAGAHAAGRLDMLRLALDGRPIAMLVNFIAPPGSFSFKIAFDEAYARFSPGVLVQLENLPVIERGDIAWMDSCAAEDHPMINSLWVDRRELVRVSVALRGMRRRAVFSAVRLAERLLARMRRR